LTRFAFDNLLASPGAIIYARGELIRIPTLVPARRTDDACRFLTCDLRLKMASGGSKRWRALYGESTIYEMLPEIGWKVQMAVSGKWKLDMAESRKILHRTFKSSFPAPNPTHYCRGMYLQGSGFVTTGTERIPGGARCSAKDSPRRASSLAGFIAYKTRLRSLQNCRATESLLLDRGPLPRRRPSPNPFDGAGHLGRGLNCAGIADCHGRLVCDFVAERHLIAFHCTGDW
jgi:hypothetical protein